MWTCCALVKAGFGTLSEIQNLTIEEYLDAVEFYQISSKIERVGG